MILVTGACGFIGAHFAREWLQKQQGGVVALDALTYAGNIHSLFEARDNPKLTFVHGDIGDAALVRRLLQEYRPSAIVNFAAESHVDRSIHGPDAFVQTNIVGVSVLLQESLFYWQKLPETEKSKFRFLQVSTDEVYGSLGMQDAPFTEETSYAPSSPYSASKAAADHLVRAWHHTYGLPVLITNCSNNFGPAQFPEKLIPLMILNAIDGKNLPVYGDGQNVRDWLHVSDHCSAIRAVLDKGAPGETYCIGANNERDNLAVVKTICAVLDDLQPRDDKKSYSTQIQFVTDRPGHDRRYAIDATKMQSLGWQPEHRFEQALVANVKWYLTNPEWVHAIKDGSYSEWLNTNYQKREAA